MADLLTPTRPRRTLPTRVGRGVVLLCAAVTPGVVAYAGMLLVVRQLQSLQPDGDLEPGGNFAMLVAMAATVVSCYVVSLLAVLALWSRATAHAGSVLLTVLGASIVVTAIAMALNWQ